MITGTGREVIVRGTIHHCCWEKNQWNREPLPKRVRQDKTYQLMLEAPVHRLLHAVIRPPRIPSEETLRQMRDLSHLGLIAVMNELDDPIVEHFDRQLTVATISPEVALDLLTSGRFREWEYESQVAR